MLTAYRRRVKSHRFHYAHYVPQGSITLPHYEPASWQAEAFHSSDNHIKALFGGDRSGKTGTVSYEMLSLMRQHPGELFWTAALTEEKLYAIWQWHKKLLHPAEYDEPSWRVSQEIPKFFRHKNGAKMEYKTMKQGAGPFAGDSVKAIHLDEDGARVTTQAEKIFNDCQSRIMDNNGYLFVSATPVLGKNWMYRRLERANQDATESGKPDKRIKCWTVSVMDNKFISDEFKLAQKAGMSADEIDRRFYGLFTTLSGAVFKEFREDVHVLTEEPVISASWRRIRAIDLGYENPFCCLWIAQDEDGCLWVYDEYYQAQKLISYHAAEIERITQSHNDMMIHVDGSFRVIESTVCDHERQTRAELESAGIYTVPAQKDVESGIQAVNRRLMIDSNQRTRFYISPRCRNLIRQMGNYHYKSVPDGRENKEVIDKVDDHAVDPLRYGVVYFETGSGGYHSITA